MRVSDLVQAFPVLITGMILVTLWPGRMPNNDRARRWRCSTRPIYVRLTRVEVLTQRQPRLRRCGAGARATARPSIALRHVLPNALGAVADPGFGDDRLRDPDDGRAEFRRRRRPPADARAGADDRRGRRRASSSGEWWPSLFPGLAISITVFGYAAFGNGLERHYARS